MVMIYPCSVFCGAFLDVPSSGGIQNVSGPMPNSHCCVFAVRIYFFRMDVVYLDRRPEAVPLVPAMPCCAS